MRTRGCAHDAGTLANFFTVEGKEKDFEGAWVGGVAYFRESGR